MSIDSRTTIGTRQECSIATVTFLFSDIERSTALLSRLGDLGYANALHAHRAVLRAAFRRHGGVEIDASGDAFFYVFRAARDAVAAAADAQAALAGGRIRVRIGVHTGEALVFRGEHIGIEVHRAARIAAAAHGGQVLLSAASRALVEADVRELGAYRLKDFPERQQLFELAP